MNDLDLNAENGNASPTKRGLGRLAWAVITVFGILLLVLASVLRGQMSDAAQPAEPLEVLTMPAGHDARVPLPVVVWLHGYGDGPSLAAAPYFAQLADTHRVAVLGIAGPLKYEEGDERGFQWSEDVPTDADHVAAAFVRVSRKVVAQRGQVVLFGFSQGAALAAEIAARDPERYAGAIMMSPGTRTNLSLDGAKRAPASATQRYFVTVGAGEHPGNLSTAATYHDKLKGLGSQVTLRQVSGQDDHSFPEDFDQHFATWLRDILSTRSPQPTSTRQPAQAH